MKHLRRALCLLLTLCLAAGITTALAQNADGVVLKYGTPPPTEAPATPEPAPAEDTPQPAEEPGTDASTDSQTGGEGSVEEIVPPSPDVNPEPTENASQPGAEPDWVRDGMPGRDLAGYEDDRNGGGAKGMDPYVVSVASREETDKDNPRTVLITGTVYAPEGTAIRDVLVIPDGGTPVRPAEVVRFRSAATPPDGVDGLSSPADRNRNGFAFLVDLSGNGNVGEDGAVLLTVRIAVGDYRAEFVPIMVYVSGDSYTYPDVEHALRGLSILKDEHLQEVNWLQDKLAEKEYLDDEQKSTFYDADTARAMKDVCAINDLEYSEDGVKPETLQAVLSDKIDGKNSGIKGYLKRYLTIADYDIPVWMLAAAGAALILIILILVLVITGAKRRKKKKAEFGGGFGDPVNAPHTDPEAGGAPDGGDLYNNGGIEDIGGGEMTGGGLGQNIGGLQFVGDEPTAELENPQSPGGINFVADGVTVDLACKVMFRMFYGGQYMDTETDIPEGGQKILGRGQDAEIQTNPSDNSVSHRHGYFAVQGGVVTYTDTSRNGTRINGQQTLHNGEKITVPFNTKVQLELGAHKIWVFAKRPGE